MVKCHVTNTLSNLHVEKVLTFDFSVSENEFKYLQEYVCQLKFMLQVHARLHVKGNIELEKWMSLCVVRGKISRPNVPRPALL